MLQSPSLLLPLALGLCLLNFLAGPVFGGVAPVPVFVSILPQKHFVERIGGEQVAVSVMVGPGRSPATYEPTPRQMEELSRARLYFRIGVPFEDVWMKRLAANNPHLLIIDGHRGIERLPTEVHPHLGQYGHVVKDKPGLGALDPHVWTSPARVKVMAATLLEELCQTSPDNREYFVANYRRFVADLEALERELREQLASLTNRRFLVFHPSWGYFAQDFALEQIAIETGGKEPGAKTLATLIEGAKRDRIRVVFVQQQFSRTAAETIAVAIGGRVVAVDPLAEDYFGNLRAAAAAFTAAMRQP